VGDESGGDRSAGAGPWFADFAERGPCSLRAAIRHEPDATGSDSRRRAASSAGLCCTRPISASRLVKLCTRRFRGNVVDMAPNAIMIGSTPCLRHASVFEQFTRKMRNRGTARKPGPDVLERCYVCPGSVPAPGISGRQYCNSSLDLSRPSSSRGLPCPVRRWRSTVAMNSSIAAVTFSRGWGSGLSSVIETACHGIMTMVPEHATQVRRPARSPDPAGRLGLLSSAPVQDRVPLQPRAPKRRYARPTACETSRTRQQAP